MEVDVIDGDATDSMDIGGECDLIVGEEFFGDSASSDAAGGFSCGSATTTAIVEDPVFFEVGEVGMSGAHEVFDGLIARRVGIFVKNDDGEGSASGFSFKNTRENFS